MKKSGIAVVVIAALLPASAFADPPTAPVASGLPAVISPLKKGQTAPFSGILFSPRAAASVVTEIGATREKTKVEVDSAVAASEAKWKYEIEQEKARHAAESASTSARLQAERARAEEAEKAAAGAREESPSRAFWGGAGVVGGIVLTLLTLFVSSHAN